MKIFSTISLVMILAFGFVYSSQPGNQPDKKAQKQEELSKLKPECPYLQEKQEKSEDKAESPCPYLRNQEEKNRQLDEEKPGSSEINEYRYIRTFKSKYT